MSESRKSDSNDFAGRLVAAIEDTCVSTGGIAKGTQLSGPQALMAMSDLSEEFLRLREVEATYQSDKPQLDVMNELREKVDPTTKVERFEDALTVLAGGVCPDRALVEAWFDEDDDQSHIRLQEWAMNNSAAGWAMGIGIIDAALVLADNPDEGVDHKF